MKKKYGYKNVIAFLIDASVALIAFYLGLWIRFGELSVISEYFSQSLYFSGIVIIVNYLFKIHRGIWRYFNVYYFVDISKAVTVSVTLFILISFFIQQLSNIPRSVLLIDWFLLVALLALPRVCYRFYFDKTINSIFRTDNPLKSPIIIAGLGRSAEVFISELNRMRGGRYKVVGIIDKNLNRGRRVYNVPVLGELDDIEEVVADLAQHGKRPTRIIVSPEFYMAGQLKKLLKITDKLAIPVSRIPKVTELEHTITAAVPLPSIPLEDLLGREQRTLDREAIEKKVHNKRILVTGAGGSIGSEILRQVCEFGPAEICLVDNSEFLLYEIEQWSILKYPGLKQLVRLCDIRDKKAVARVFADFKPDIVFHAAALKHVPLMESHKCDAVKTNIFGTKNILDASLDNGVLHFVMISTDKAVDPSSFMGATKRFAELYCQARGGGKTAISIVRFGNVLGSNGSVVPLFKKQIAEGGPITITDREATRFFMTIREAVGLVLQATTLKGGMKSANTGVQIFVLDMGEPVRILDIAEHMVMLAGLKPDIDIKIEIIGLRPGEKLHEILVTEHEALEKTERADIHIANPRIVALHLLQESLIKLEAACSDLDSEACSKVVNNVVNAA